MNNKTWKEAQREQRLSEGSYYQGVAKYDDPATIYTDRTPYDYGYGFSFRKPTADSTYVKTLQILNDKGPLTKRAILTELTKIGAIPPRKEVDTLDYYHNVNDWQRTIRPVKPEEYWNQPEVSPRGQHSSMFIPMKKAGLISYDVKTREWAITEKGKKLLKDNNLEK